jgi:AcrR family transcriptional regulator
MTELVRRGRRRSVPVPAEVPLSQIGNQRSVELIEAALSIIAEKGLEGLRTRDVAARAGVNIATLHYYFETKESLILGVIEHIRDVFIEPEPGMRRSPAKAPENIRNYFIDAWRKFQRNPHLAIVGQELMLRARRDPEAAKALRRVHDYWNELVEGILRRGMADGQIRADLDPCSGARILTSFTSGAMTHLGVNPKAFDFLAVSKLFEQWLSAISPAEESRINQTMDKGRRARYKASVAKLEG